jgi:hypothetical protein
MSLNTLTTDRKNAAKKNSLVEVPDSELNRQIAKADKALREEPRKQIYIPPDPNKEVQECIPVGLNGMIFLIPRDKDVSVPYSVYTILQNLKYVR